MLGQWIDDDTIFMRHERRVTRVTGGTIEISCEDCGEWVIVAPPVDGTPHAA